MYLKLGETTTIQEKFFSNELTIAINSLISKISISDLPQSIPQRMDGGPLASGILSLKSHGKERDRLYWPKSYDKVTLSGVGVPASHKYRDIQTKKSLQTEQQISAVDCSA